MQFRRKPEYDAFLSYSHAADRKLAPVFQKGLHRLAKPWYRLRALHVFRDETNLSANPDLWKTIEDALRSSRNLLLFASPEAAKSKWVKKEIAFWHDDKGPANVFILLTAGEFVWDEDRNAVDWQRTTALPQMTELDAAIGANPHWVDLRPFQGVQIDPRNADFMDRVATIAAPLHGKSKEKIYGEDIRQHKTTMRLAWSAVSLLVVLLIVALGAAALAEAGRLRAQYNLVSNHLALGDNALRDDRIQEAVYWYWRAYDDAPGGDPRSLLARQLVAGWSSQWQHLRYPSAVTALALRPDGAIVAIGGADGGLHLRRTHDGSLVAALPAERDPISQLRFSHDGSRIAIVRKNDTTVHSLDRNTIFPPLMHTGEAVERVAFTMDNAFLVGVDRSGGTRRWKLKGPCPECAASRNPSATDRKILDLSADGRFLAINTATSTVVVKDLQSGKIYGPFQHEVLSIFSNDQLVQVRLDPTGRILVTMGIETIRLWNIPEVKSRGEPIPHKGQFFDAVLSVRDGSIVTGGREGMRIWSADTRKEVPAWFKSDTTVQVVATAARSATMAAGDDNGLVSIYRSPAHRLLQDHQDGIFRIIRMPHRPAQFVYSDGGQLHQIDATTGSHRLLRASNAPMFTVAMHPNGTIAAVGGFDEVRLWDLRHPGKEEVLNHSSTTPGGGPVRVLAFSPDGRYLVTMDRGTLRLWRLNGIKGSLRWTTSAGFSSVGGAVAFSPDGRLILAGDFELHLLDFTSRPRKVLSMPASTYQIIFSPDGSKVVTSGFDNRARFWTWPALEPIGVPLLHDASVLTVSYSSDGRLVLTSSADTTVRLWDATTYRQIVPAWKQSTRVDAAVFGPMNRTVITGNADGQVIRWDAPPPAIDDREHLQLSMEVRSGYTRDALGGRRPLSYDEWNARQKQLMKRNRGFGDVRGWNSVIAEQPPNWWGRLWARILSWN